MEPITFAATGDSFITRRLPDKDRTHKAVSKVLQQADVRFTNLEVTVHDGEGVPSAVSGGAWAGAHPSVLQDLKTYGFNTVAWANNHTLDFLYGGLESTKKHLDRYGFVHAGVGNNLAEASKPVYLETSNGRVALISVTSTFHESWRAGEQRPDMIGRPGVNPLRYNTVYEVKQSDMDTLKSIAKKVDINALNNMYAQVGLLSQSDENVFTFGSHKFKVGTNEREITTPHEQDRKRILKSIAEAKRQADYVIVSIHSHEMKGENKEEPADFSKAISRECIDQGADSVIGHGPHILRGIEIYKNRPIFYSLGNFIFQNDTMTSQPTEFYDKYGLDHYSGVAQLFDSRTRNETRGFVIDEKIWVSVIPVWKMEHGKLVSLSIYPIDLGYKIPRSRRGWPSLNQRHDILEMLQVLSSPFGTKIKIENGVGVLLLD